MTPSRSTTAPTTPATCNPDDPHGGAVCSTDHPASGVIRDTIARFGDKWSILVIGLLQDGPQRFGDLHRRVDGISHRMLSQTLRSLERDGLVSRTSYPEVPPRVEYAATELGRSLSGPIVALVNWAADNHLAIFKARTAFDAAAEAVSATSTTNAASTRAE